MSCFVIKWLTCAHLDSRVILPVILSGCSEKNGNCSAWGESALL